MKAGPLKFVNKMSTKRVLYKPAVKEKVLPHEPRRTLAQGRLISHSGSTGMGAMPSGSEQEAGRQRDDSGPQIQRMPAHISHEPSGHHQLTGARTDTNTSHSTHASKSLSARTDHVSGLTVNGSDTLHPRRETPHASMAMSPQPAHPTVQLDLSDTESDLNLNQRPGRPDVLLVDASQPLLAADNSEVQLRLGFEHSPVRVVCHSPAKVQSDLRDTGSVERACRVPVDSVRRVSVLAPDDEYKAKGHKKSPTGGCNPLVIRESSFVSGGRGDPSSAARMHSAKKLFDSDLEDSGHTQHLQTYRPTKVMHDDTASEVSEVCELSGETSESHDESGPSTVTSGCQLSKVRSESLDIGRGKPKDKKGKVRVIASRYMQAAPSKKGPMKATDRSVIGSTVTGTSKTKVSAPPARSSSLNRGRPGSSTQITRDTSLPNSGKQQSSGKKAVRRKVRETPPHEPGVSKTSSFSRTSSKGGMVSTPVAGTAAGGIPLVEGGIDVSAIGPPQHGRNISSFCGTPNMADSYTGSRYKSSHQSLGSSNNDSHPSHDAPPDKQPAVTQQELSLLYARYVQMLYLDRHSRHTFKEQEKDSMSQMYALWNEVEKLHKQETDLEQQLAHLKHLNSLDETLSIQQNGLDVVTSDLPKVASQHALLSQALDTTRHQLPVSGVYIPGEDDPTFTDSLTQALEESSQLLGELDTMTRPNAPNITATAQALATMDRTLHDQLTCIPRCDSLLFLAEQLTVKESSMQYKKMLPE